MHPDIAARRARFRELHEAGCFILPNPWDPGSARFLESLGFPALATTSSGHAWSRARADGEETREAALEHLREIVAATTVPINADFLNGFGATPEAVAESVRLAVETGVAGLSIEDSSGDPQHPQFEQAAAVERVSAARAAIDASGGDALLVARAENFFVGHPDLDDTIARLVAYAEAGADCLYAPALQTREQVRAVVAAVAPKPVNVLIGPLASLRLDELAALGVRRVSVGGALARVAWGGFMRAARLMAAEGRFDVLREAAPHAELNGLFRQGEV